MSTTQVLSVHLQGLIFSDFFDQSASFNKHRLNAHFMPGSVSQSGIQELTIDKLPLSWNLRSVAGRELINKSSDSDEWSENKNDGIIANGLLLDSVLENSLKRYLN